MSRSGAPAPRPGARGTRVLLLGAGMQGKAALHDLVAQQDVAHVAVADADPALPAYLTRYPASRVSSYRLNAADSRRLAALISDADVVVEALPGPFALPVARIAADCGVPLVSSMYLVAPGEDDASRLAAARQAVAEMDRTAREKGIVILAEFGLDPGLDLVLGARAIREFDAVHEFRGYGAGLPAPDARDNPLQYRFSWSPIGVMRSYHRPARLVEGGREVIIAPAHIFEPAHVHHLDIPALEATLECYPNGDAVHYATLFGIRDTVHLMGRYTGRLPGHCAFWDTMVKCGFLDEQPVPITGGSVAPLEFTAALLASQPQFQYGDRDADMTFVRVDVRGMRAGKRMRVTYDLVDRRDLATGFLSMQRTVGFTLSLGAQLILRDALPRRGVLTPLDVPYDLVFPALEQHGIRVHREETAWS